MCYGSMNYDEVIKEARKKARQADTGNKSEPAVEPKKSEHPVPLTV